MEKEMTCPKCGASLKIQEENHVAVCEFCGYNHILEKEETAEEIRQKAESKSYGYHMGKIKAEDDLRRKNNRKHTIRALIICAVIFAVIIGAIGSCTVCYYVSMEEINPFDYLEVTFQGVEGEGKITMDIASDTDGIDMDEVKFTASSSAGLHPGDTVVITASSSTYRLSQREQEYTVEGLEEYIKDPMALSDEDIELIHSVALSVQESNLEDLKKGGYVQEIKPVMMYLVLEEERYNTLYDVFEVKLNVDGTSKSIFVTTRMCDVIIHEGSPDTLGSTNRNDIGGINQAVGWRFFFGEYTLDAVKMYILSNQTGSVTILERAF